jgi:hypothetical protein
LVRRKTRCRVGARATCRSDSRSVIRRFRVGGPAVRESFNAARRSPRGRAPYGGSRRRRGLRAANRPAQRSPRGRASYGGSRRRRGLQAANRLGRTTLSRGRGSFRGTCKVGIATRGPTNAGRSPRFVSFSGLGKAISPRASRLRATLVQGCCRSGLQAAMTGRSRSSRGRASYRETFDGWLGIGDAARACSGCRLQGLADALAKPEARRSALVRRKTRCRVGARATCRSDSRSVIRRSRYRGSRVGGASRPRIVPGLAQRSPGRRRSYLRRRPDALMPM